jgi:hypothetical protein
LGPIAITLLMALAFATFGAPSMRKLRIVRALQPEARFDAPLQRLRSVLVNGLLQRRMVLREWRPGLMHAMLFVGFVSLLLRKLQMIAIGYRETATYPEPFGGPFAAFKDTIELLVVLAAGFALLRRLVLKPARLERNREALAILCLILAIMLTDIVFDGCRFSLLSSREAGVAPERDHAYLGRGVGARCRASTAAAWDGPTSPATGRRWQWCSGSWCGCRSASTSTSSPRCRRCISVAGGPPTECPLSTSTRSWRRRTRRRCALARPPRATFAGRRGSTSSPAPSAAAARTRARPTRPASRCR